MDPQAAWDQLLAAYADRDWQQVDELAAGLVNWLGRGGFPPQTSPSHQLDDAWNRAVSRFACEFAIDQAQKGGG